VAVNEEEEEEEKEEEPETILARHANISPSVLKMLG